ncbi:UPF0489 family protein [Cytophagales bacterium LB-30]|uniref:UPF0489 family protein n=1 Tax=Shiella aurantiaca TaxID=3058365 RepID=A0ABT8F2C4_9BACT|nr:UPF0489 family protein [Shiella aurantiaca]MDN4164555.1 UPF0489 family protein [Shiella aurantiaca]
MLNILINKGKNTSLGQNLNYFACKDDIFIMDNHLAAIWCWDRLPKDKNITLVHIDAHYDLGTSPPNGSIYQELDLITIPINKITDYKHPRGYNYFLWDNYIHVFNDKYPGLINEFISITHRLGNFNELATVEIEEYDIWHLNSNLWKETQNRKILNIDIDYFFKQNYKSSYELFSDSLVSFFSSWLLQNLQKFDIVTVALSPECCGSWENSISMANKIFEPLSIKVEI